MISTNRVSINTNDWRWEPSSSVGSTWVTSWKDIASFRSYTSAWAGSFGWYTRFHHTMNAHETGDLFLLFNALQGRHNLALLDLANLNVGFRKSTDGSGCSWEAPVVALALGDYPSVAVASNGTIVIGSHIVVGDVDGFQTVVSTNGGQNWNGPYPVIQGQDGFQGRVVASGNKFHAFFATSSATHPTVVLKRFESTDGANWSQAPLPLDSYTAPQRFSPLPDYCNPATGDCGRIHYATGLDAVAAPGLGWVVLYPLANPADGSINSLKFCAESMVGCRPIDYSTDLFLHGVTASSSGDMWVTMYSYSGAPNRTLPLVQIAGYGATPSATFLSGTVNTNIDATSWRFIPNASRCREPGFFGEPHNCFSAGDYMRPAMNTLTTASLPFIVQSPRKTDLKQTFVDDPQVGLPSVPGLLFGPLLPFGSDSTFKGILSPQEIQARRRDFVTSARFLLEAAGLVTGP